MSDIVMSGFGISVILLYRNWRKFDIASQDLAKVWYCNVNYLNKCDIVMSGFGMSDIVMSEFGIRSGTDTSVTLKCQSLA